MSFIYQNVEQYQIPGFYEYKYIRIAENLSNYNNENIIIHLLTVRNLACVVNLIVMPDKLFQITVSLNILYYQTKVSSSRQLRICQPSKKEIKFVVLDDIYDGYKYQSYVIPHNIKLYDEDPKI